MEFKDKNEVLAVARASTGRRILGLTSLGVLGVLLIYIAFLRPPSLGWQVFLIALGAASLWCADKMRKSTASCIELTPTELRDGDGTVIARVADIQSMDRGVFAFKPSNGFLIRTADAEPGVWRPGLWWRTGRRVGIGGMTPGNQTKFMSEVLSAMMATREQGQ
ncbi:hypothetical protein HKX54_01600 [Sulfitobacter sp. M57]|uniref:hypothetical protein n=1 Tax=unclassified Sulfitobacter TaxID=196795 RepID=UPI0023E31599|nr:MULTISPECIES: hypothetical protein [unclassified Sulfitobacter]MDF3413136.1 hypothetical protein [Sulfitobacter sp. KE5]MDF3421581.1 hypothetical protein [Sulfitobacter sp. KE43]MDF3431685.1 hypothetical protein [Sulfitobacter sp. KE42]MDF3457326.1 hypothetical protein [Sulfitobacter sp. S74]MDF3461228.1 hypothetical protein [Sulfitobacter sp. Ks18]